MVSLRVPQLKAVAGSRSVRLTRLEVETEETEDCLLFDQTHCNNLICPVI